MVVRQIGFQGAVSVLQRMPAPSGAQQSQEPEQELPARSSENPPLRASYETFFKPHAWLTERGLTGETLKHYEVGYYENQARKSQYSGFVMLKIRRWKDGEWVCYLIRNIGEVTPEKPKYRLLRGVRHLPQDRLQNLFAVQGVRN